MAIYYYQDGTTEDVHEDNVDLFLEQNPTATLEPIKAKKTNDVAEPGAAVASETTAPESGDSPSESTSSEFPTLTDQASTAEEAKAAGLDVIPGGRQEGDTIFGVTIPEVSANPLTFEEQLDEEKSELETKINNFSTNTAKAKKVLDDFERQNIGEGAIIPPTQETYDEYNNLVKAYNLALEEQDEIAVMASEYESKVEEFNKTGKDQELTAKQSIKNSFSNVWQDGKNAVDYWFGEGIGLDLATDVVYRSVFGDERVDAFIEKHRSKGLEPDDTFLGIPIGDVTEGLLTTEERIGKIKSFEAKQQDRKPTLEVLKSFGEGKILDGAASVLSAIVNVGGSVIYNTGTAGTGYFMDFAAQNYIDYNNEIAESKGKTLEELIRDEEDDGGQAVKLASLQAGAEYFGFSKIKKALGGKMPVPKLMPKKVRDKFNYNPKAKTTLNILTTGKTESATEVFQGAIEEYNKKSATDPDVGFASTLLEYAQSPEGMEAGVQGFVGAGGLATGSYSARAASQARQGVSGLKVETQINELLSLSEIIAKTKDETVRQGLEVKRDSKAQELSQNIRRGNKLYSQLGEAEIAELENIHDIADTQAARAVELQKKFNKKEITEQEYKLALEGYKQSYDDAQARAREIMAAKQTEDVKKKAEELGATVTTKTSEEVAESFAENVALLEAEIEGAEQVLEQGLDPNSQEVQNALGVLNNAPEQLKGLKQADTSYGFISQKADGTPEIIINKDKPKFGTAAHEFLHLVLANTLKGDMQLQDAMGGALTKFVSDKKGGVSQAFIDRMSAYVDKETGVQDVNFGEETITIMSESILDGSLEFNDNLFTKIGDVIRQTARRLGWTDVKFNTGKDVYNFIKDYNASIEKGYTSKAITKVATEGAKGKLITPVTKATEGEQFSKESDASNKVQEIYNEQGEAGLFDILEEFKPITTRIARRFRDVPGYDEQLIIDEIETGKRGIFDLIREYKPESGVPLAAYINKFLPARSIEAGNRILKTEFEEDITEARGVAAEETVEQQPERKTKAKVLASELNIADKVASEVSDASIDPSTLTNFKSVPNAVTNAVGELLGISPAKIKSKANLTKNEVASAQRWFNKNAQLVVDALPQGFDVEGQATGVPRTVLQALYTQKEGRAKTKAGLKGQIKRTNIKNSEFLELVDIIDGKPTRNRNTSARIIALADLLGKTITNQELRKTDPSLARIRSGMSDVMFSKAIRDFSEDKQSILFEKLAEVTAEINPAYVNVKNTKDVVRSLKEIYGEDFSTQEVNKIAKELSKLAEVYEPVVSNKKVIPEKTWTEFVAENFDQAADNIIEAIQLTVDGKTPTAASLYDNIEFVARGRRAVIELGNHLLEKGKSIEEVARVMAILKPMYASSAKIGRGKISVDKNGNLFLVKGDKFGSPRGQVFTNVKDFETNAVLKIQGMTPEIWKSTNTKLLAQKSKDAVKNPNYSERLAEAKEARQAIDLMMNFFNDSDFHNDLDIAMFMISNLSNMGAPLRRAANLQYIADAVLKMNVNDLGKLAEYEHLIPANYMAIKIIQAYKSGDKVNVDNLYKNYKVAVIPKTMDDVIKKQGLQSKMHAGYDFENDASTDRYYNFLTAGFKNIVTIRDISTKEVIGPKVELLDNPIERTKKSNLSEAISNARPVMQYSKESKGMSTFDFDETLIIDGENFVTATKDNDVVKIPSDKWPIDGPKLAAEGYDFDFSDFVNVRGGKEGPLLQKMRNQIKKYGPKNVFVLTARMQEAAEPIHKWLKSNGITIPIENITGLGKSEGDAKAQWFLDKYAEGYNDMYFVDDAMPNVDAVKHVFDQLDIKGKSVQAKIQFSKELSPEFNKMLERTKGIGAEKVFSRIGAQKRGKNVGRFTFFVPPSADDFAGLLRYFVGKGEQGNKDLQFFNEALIKPFARADRDMKEARQSILDDHKALRKELPQVAKKLGKMVDDSGFTFDNAIRVYLWDKSGFDIPGLAKRDISFLTSIVKKDQDLKTYADIIGQISKQKEGYVEPSEYWNVESIAADLQNVVNKQGRKKFLAEWKENVETIFSPENLNKIEATYGSNYREALENALWRMENGTNRAKGMGRLEGAWNNWVNNSVGAIMFFNARSAVLQTLSTVNFINFEDNNIFAAAKAFANQKQYWKDFSFLFNSDFLKQRRAGLQTNINEAEIASAVAGATNKAKAALQYLLKQGFLPTQIADSFAIASGGSTYYRNRVKKYVKEGMSQANAETQAMEDFMEIAEETQQSARPDRISQQQASSLGRIILAFANTPMQYARLIKKAAGDLTAGRGDWRSNVSRIIYYGAIQNIIFSSLQSAIFALAFDDEEPEQDEIDRKVQRTLNGMIDSLLRGSGLAGAVVSTLKNVINKFIQESEKKSRADYGNVLVDALNVSPPIGSKSRKLYNATKTYKYNREVMGEMNTFDLENPVWDAVGNVVSATTNLPLDRGFRKIDNMKEALNQDNETWQRIFVGLGWDQWGLGIDSRKEVEEAREEIKEKKKEEKKKTQQRCTKIKSDGTRCKLMVTKPKTRCHYHD